jgi:4-hydroxy-tetrahydrodipicolinate synthase
MSCASNRWPEILRVHAPINDKLLGLHKHLFIEANPIPVKWAVQQMGLIKSGIRLPLTPLTENCFSAVKQAMQQAGVLN